MSKSEKLSLEIEILPSRDSTLRAGIDEKTLNRIVQERVAEILADRDALVFEPFFRSRQIAYELRRLQSVPEQQKWSVFFERQGCLVCETRERIHVSNGMCNRCYARTFATLKQIIAEGMNGEPAHPSRRASAAAESEPAIAGLLPIKSSHRRWNKPRKRKRT